MFHRLNILICCCKIKIFFANLANQLMIVYQVYQIFKIVNKYM